jgi:hypothetical protein
LTLTQSLLEEDFRASLDAEEVCRAFLELAKACSRRLVDMMFGDAGELACGVRARVRVRACVRACDGQWASCARACISHTHRHRRRHPADAHTGLVEQWRRMYGSPEWLAGTTTATILATIGGAWCGRCSCCACAGVCVCVCVCVCWGVCVCV